MTLQATNDQNVFSGTSPSDEHDDDRMPDPTSANLSWPQRLIARIKQGERFRACAYFLSTIL